MLSKFVGFIRFLATALLGASFVAMTVYAATTVGTDITTGGTLTVSGLSQLNGGASTTQITATLLSVGTTATTTIAGNGATSTFSNSINLTGGCFAVAGTCITGGSGGASLSSANTWTAIQTFSFPTVFTNSISISAGRGIDVSSTNPLEIGTTTASGVTIGRSTITTTIPGSLAAGTSTFSGPITVSGATSSFANGIQLSSGCFRDASGTCVGSSSSGSSTPAGGTGAVQYANGSLFAGDNAKLVWDSVNFRLGISTSTPFTSLSVSGGVAGTHFMGTSATSSTFGGNLVVNGSATSTFSNSINLTSGCFAVAGTCIAGGSGGISLSSVNVWTAQQIFPDILVQPGTFGIDTTATGTLRIGTATSTSILIGRAIATTTFDGGVLVNGTLSLGGNATATDSGNISMNGKLTVGSTGSAIGGIVFGTCTIQNGTASISPSTGLIFLCTTATAVTSSHTVFVQSSGGLPNALVLRTASSTGSGVLGIEIYNASSTLAIQPGASVINFLGIQQ